MRELMEAQLREPEGTPEPEQPLTARASWPGSRDTQLATPGSRFGSSGLWLMAPGMALYGLFVLWPLVQVCRLAFFRWNGYGPQTFVGLGNVRSLLGDGSFRTSLTHSALWEAGALVVLPCLGLGIALLLTHSRARPLFLAAFFFPALLPPTVVAAIWVLLYSPVSGPLARIGVLPHDWLGNPHLALGALFLAWAWSVLGVGVLVFRAGLTAIGREYVDLAVVEGAGALWRFLHVTLPGLRRSGTVVLLLNAALAVQVFDLIFVTTGGGPGYATMIVPLDVYGRAFGGRTGQGAAAACAQILLALALAGCTLALLRRRDESLDAADMAGSQPARYGWVGRAPALRATCLLAGVLVVLALPLIWLVIAALEPGRAFALGSAGPGLDPRQWDWSNFQAVWDAGMGGALGTSLLLALAVTFATLILAIPAAFVLAHVARARASAVSLPLLLVGLLQPTPVLIIPLFSLIKNLGLLDSLWGVALPETARALPFAVLVLWGFMAQSPREILEAAQVDGASVTQQMIGVALPVVRPAIYAVAIWSFVTSWNEYLLPTLVSQDGSIQTVPTLLASFIGQYDTQYGSLAAGSLMAILPSLTLYLLLRHPAAAGIAGVEGTMQWQG